MISPCLNGPWASGTRYIEPMRPGMNAVPFALATAFNSAYPEDRNNGAMWSGRGLSASFEGGVEFRLGALSLAAIPTIAYQQNRSYQMLPPAVVGNSAYSSGLYVGIDLPQRFGPRSSSKMD
ncbi:MAG TPA: hypothetical protein VJ865_12970, partial [Gemmatimonadaceae bacterium]|nr:hypothetical protein [Gemmatimonadaceae bacterium]